MRLLIDSDIILFQACCSTEYTMYAHETEGVWRKKREMDAYLKFNFDDDEEQDVRKGAFSPFVVTEPIKHTYQALDTIISSLVRKTGADSYLLVIKGKEDNFRKSIPYPVEYKGGRPPKPSNYDQAVAYLHTLPCTHACTGPWEVDDELGILQDKSENPSTIIATIDKDILYGLPGLKWNIEKEIRFYTTEKEAERFFWQQMLMGDSVDNVVGVKGIGPVKAQKLIGETYDRPQWKETVEAEYQRYFGDSWKQMFDANQRHLWILGERPEQSFPV